MSKLAKVLIPSYMQGFKCIGGACEDSCCIGWNIDIDKLTYHKYFRTDNMEMKDRFKKSLYKNDGCELEEIDYGGMKIPESKWCPFLNNDKLCDIYTNLGEDYLSNVCHSYPRIYNVLNDIYEISLYMSCPEAARMILLDKNPIKFAEKSIKLDKHIIHSYVDTRNKQFKNSPIKLLKDLRLVSIKTIQNRDNSIEERVRILGKILKNRDNFSPLKVDNSYLFQLSFFKETLGLLNVFSEIDSPQFVSHTTTLMKELRLDEAIELNVKANLYQNVMVSIVEPFIRDNRYLFENYLVNSIYQGNFPFTVNQDQFDGYIMLVVRFTFIRFYLAGIALKQGSLSVNDVVDMVQVHTKTINHHQYFIQQTLENIKDRELDNIDFTSILLG